MKKVHTQWTFLICRGAHAALQFILARSEVPTFIPVAKCVEQAPDNLAATEQRLISEAMSGIEAFWEQEIKANPPTW